MNDSTPGVCTLLPECLGIPLSHPLLRFGDLPHRTGGDGTGGPTTNETLVNDGLGLRPLLTLPRGIKSPWKTD